MAYKARRYCAKYPCPNLAEPGSSFCLAHQPASTPATKKVRKPFYINPGWKRYRKWYLSGHPLCERCQRHGKTVPATLVHHIVELEDGGEPFDPANTEALCASCHNKVHGKRGGDAKVYGY